MILSITILIIMALSVLAVGVLIEHYKEYDDAVVKRPVIINKQLEMFLHKENVYDKFMKNAKEQWSKDLAEGDTEILDAFIWYDTPEGHDYWKDLDKKYNQYLKNTI